MWPREREGCGPVLQEREGVWPCSSGEGGGVASESLAVLGLSNLGEAN